MIILIPTMISPVGFVPTSRSEITCTVHVRGIVADMVQRRILLFKFVGLVGHH